MTTFKDDILDIIDGKKEKIKIIALHLDLADAKLRIYTVMIGKGRHLKNIISTQAYETDRIFLQGRSMLNAQCGGGLNTFIRLSQNFHICSPKSMREFSSFWLHNRVYYERELKYKGLDPIMYFVDTEWVRKEIGTLASKFQEAMNFFYSNYRPFSDTVNGKLIHATFLRMLFFQTFWNPYSMDGLNDTSIRELIETGHQGILSRLRDEFGHLSLSTAKHIFETNSRDKWHSDVLKAYKALLHCDTGISLNNIRDIRDINNGLNYGQYTWTKTN